MVEDATFEMDLHLGGRARLVFEFKEALTSRWMTVFIVACFVVGSLSGLLVIGVHFGELEVVRWDG